MPVPATALLLSLTLAPAPAFPDVQTVKCHLAIDEVCQDGLKKPAAVPVPVANTAGAGGRGGDGVINYYFVLGGSPQGGAGAAGGSIKLPNGASAPAAVQSAPPAPPVSLVLSRCKLTIAGKTEVDAKGCQYDKSGQQFTLTAPSENQKHTYRIKVAFNEDKTGQGSLAGGRTDKVRDLGTLMRKGACWAREDQTVEICAWK